jgi:hypothetical protein
MENDKKTNNSINNNIIKDTQESVELKLSEELKEITFFQTIKSNNNTKIKLYKLKYVLKLICSNIKKI